MPIKNTLRRRGIRLASLFAFLAVFTLTFPGVSSAFAASAESTGVGSASSAAPQAATPHVNIAIQAGHWKESELPDALARLRTSTGASGGGKMEYQVNLDIAQRAATMLRAKGYTVEVLPATVPTGYTADLFIALHADGNTSTAARGFKVSTRWRSDVAALDALLVQSIQSTYGSVTGMPQDSSITNAMRGYYAYSTYRGQDYRLGSTTPAAILEMGFMTSPKDRNIMFNSPNTVASGVVAGILKYYSQLDYGKKLQAQASAQAAASQFGSSAVSLYDGVNIRADQSATAKKLDTINFGEAVSLNQAVQVRPPSDQNNSGNNTPSSAASAAMAKRGTQLASGSGWYKVALPTGSDAYVSRDVVVVQLK